MEFPFRDGDNDFAAHHLSFHMGIGVVFESVMIILVYRFMRGQFFQPRIVIPVESRLIIIDKNTCGYVHGIDQA